MSAKRKFLPLVLTLYFGFFMSHAWALMLSEIELHSSLNQKLDAKVELMAVSLGDLDNLKVSLTSSNKDISSYKLKYELVHGETGNYLKITSEDVIREPIVEFQLDVNWPDGRIVRKYSLLIDHVVH